MAKDLDTTDLSDFFEYFVRFLMFNDGILQAFEAQTENDNSLKELFLHSILQSPLLINDRVFPTQKVMFM